VLKAEANPGSRPLKAGITHGRDGFAAEFSHELALDACLKIIGAVARARGYPVAG
jgi:hypothetical protein